MNAYYNTIDLALYLKSNLMPSVEMSDTTATKQAALLTKAALSPVAVLLLFLVIRKLGLVVLLLQIILMKKILRLVVRLA